MLRKTGRQLAGLAMALLAVYAVLNILSVRGRLARAESYRRQLTAEIAVLTKENEQLEQEIEQADAPEVIRRLAGQKLGLVMPGEVIFKEKEE